MSLYFPSRDEFNHKTLFPGVTIDALRLATRLLPAARTENR